MMKYSGLKIKEILICLLCANLFGCATVQTPQKTDRSLPRPSVETGIDQNTPFKISNVDIRPKTFNPSKGEMVTWPPRLHQNQCFSRFETRSLDG